MTITEILKEIFVEVRKILRNKSAENYEIEKL
jgi:hypothetical protein